MQGRLLFTERLEKLAPENRRKFDFFAINSGDELANCGDELAFFVFEKLCSESL